MKKPISEVVITPQFSICSGIDIHKDIIVTHLASRDGQISETREWTTMTSQLHSLADYLFSHRVEATLMESTGVYWISLYHILIGKGLSVTVANPLHIKQIPKRKTDKKDAKWLCTLVMNGLVRQSLIPDMIQFELREHCRNRDKYRRLVTQSNNRIVRILERANIKIRSVASSIRTKSCQTIIRAIISGEKDPDKLANLCQGKLIPKKEQMREAVQGRLTKADREQLQMLQEDIQHFEKQLNRIEANIEHIEQEHFTEQVVLLEKVSGIGKMCCQQIIGEIGTDMTKFQNADHLTSWGGLSPGNNESAGKRKKVSTKRGNKHLRTAMVTVAWAAVRTKHSYWSYQYAYLKSKMPAKKAIVAIARKMLKLIFKILKDKIVYVEGGHKLYLEIQHKRQLARLHK